MKRLIISSLIMTTFFFSCNTNQGNSIKESTYSENGTADTAKVTQADWDTLSGERLRAKYISQKERTDQKMHETVTAQTKTLDGLIKKAGGLTTIKEQMSSNKCNLYQGWYVLKNKTQDSALLADLAQALSRKIYFASSSVSDCIYPKMTFVVIYLSPKDFHVDSKGVNGDCIVSSSITPSDPEGKPYVSTYRFQNDSK